MAESTKHLYISPYKNRNSKLIKNINIRPGTLNLIKGKVGKALELRKKLSELSTMIVQILRSTITNCVLVKLKTFVHQKTPSFEFRTV